jgi:hypothetical protein
VCKQALQFVRNSPLDSCFALAAARAKKRARSANQRSGQSRQLMGTSSESGRMRLCAERGNALRRCRIRRHHTPSQLSQCPSPMPVSSVRPAGECKIGQSPLFIALSLSWRQHRPGMGRGSEYNAKEGRRSDWRRGQRASRLTQKLIASATYEGHRVIWACDSWQSAAFHISCALGRRLPAGLIAAAMVPAGIEDPVSGVPEPGVHGSGIGSYG